MREPRGAGRSPPEPLRGAAPPTPGFGRWACRSATEGAVGRSGPAGAQWAAGSEAWLLDLTGSRKYTFAPPGALAVSVRLPGAGGVDGRAWLAGEADKPGAGLGPVLDPSGLGGDPASAAAPSPLALASVHNDLGVTVTLGVVWRMLGVWERWDSWEARGAGEAQAGLALTADHWRGFQPVTSPRGHDLETLLGEGPGGPLHGHSKAPCHAPGPHAPVTGTGQAPKGSSAGLSVPGFPGKMVRPSPRDRGRQGKGSLLEAGALGREWPLAVQCPLPPKQPAGRGFRERLQVEARAGHQSGSLAVCMEAA